MRFPRLYKATVARTCLRFVYGFFFLSVRLLHGRMKAEEKLDVLDALRTGTVDLLVATTVVEVGIDVPNATVIVIDNAERYAGRCA